MNKESDLISPLAYVHPEAQIGKNVKIYPFAYIERGTVIGDNCVIMSHASILEGVEIGADNYIYQNAVIGAVPQSFRYTIGHRTRVVIGQGNRIRENVVIAGSLVENTATVIGDCNFLMDGVHVCHDVHIGDDNVLGIGAQVAGECHLEHHVILSSGVILQHLVRVGRYSLVQSGCVVQKDVPPISSLEAIQSAIMAFPLLSFKRKVSTSARCVTSPMPIVLYIQAMRVWKMPYRR